MPLGYPLQSWRHCMHTSERHLLPHERMPPSSVHWQCFSRSPLSPNGPGPLQTCPVYNTLLGHRGIQSSRLTEQYSRFVVRETRLVHPAPLAHAPTTLIHAHAKGSATGSSQRPLLFRGQKCSNHRCLVRPVSSVRSEMDPTLGRSLTKAENSRERYT